MMLVSTPTHPRDSSMVLSPKYTHCTPPKQTYDSPMFTPSPLRPRPLFPVNSNVHGTNDLSSAYKAPALAHSANSFYSTIPQPITVDDEEGSIFLTSQPAAAPGSYTPFFTTSTSQPLLTPVKQTHRVFTCSPLSPRFTMTTSDSALPFADLTSVARVGVGTKRKSTPHTTPLRPNNLTPLEIGPATGFDRLAPLPAPKFLTRTPQSKAETDAYIKRQTATLTRLRLSDHISASDDEFDGAATDSGCEMDDDESANALFLHKPRVSAKAGHIPKPLVLQSPAKGKKKEEVAEAISPGGHITKRRARTRPLSAELLEQSIKYQKSPSKSGIPCRVGNNRPRHSGPVAFPTSTYRGRASPASSSSEAGSPRPRRRASGGPTLVRPHAGHNPAYPPRPPLSRIENVSAATLFFGPAIPVAPPLAHSRNNSNLPLGPTLRQPSLRPNLGNRHSYAGPESSGTDLHIWKTVQDRSLSPDSSPFPVSSESRRDSMEIDDEEMFFAGAGSSSFVLSVTRNTPSPPAKATLPMKYKHRDSLLVSDDDELPSTGSSVTGNFLVPGASTSVSSIGSEDGLVTPGVAPEGSSGWPFVDGVDGTTHPYGHESVDVDAFIMKTLAAAFKGSNMPKKIPGTPVKKVRMNYFGNDRPWQSAVASKVGLKEDHEFNKKPPPRKSMPAAFPPLGAKAAKLIHERQKSDTDTEDEDEDSPSTRRVKYVGLGLGLPPPQGPSAIPRNRWLMRRSSSGAFSSGGESTSLSSTPTRAKGIDWQLPKPRIPLRLSPSGDVLDKGSSRSTSGSSTSSSVTTLNSPTNRKQAPLSTGPGIGPRHLVPRSSVGTRRSSAPFTEDEQPGRFERDFTEVEEVGSGEFGKVIKVQSKKSEDNDALYAIKKSKQFEGVKHRLRLREEVDILKHLSQAALSQFVNGRHPNVLAYMDSWEEDEALFIRTELCESGNLARFLWEYGCVFPRLDEARVWKIVVDLSNGLRFIHDSGVIHLDLKPSNVFLTKEGRFKIGDFGMASLWPRHSFTNPERGSEGGGGGFEREGDKLYLAPEVLQGSYSKAADVFSFGMTILEISSNIVVPDQGEGWQRLRREDFSQVDLEPYSPELVELILNMMLTDPGKRPTIVQVCAHPVVRRAREKMEMLHDELKREGRSTWGASPLASVANGFLEEILDGAMDTRM